MGRPIHTVGWGPSSGGPTHTGIRTVPNTARNNGLVCTIDERGVS